MSGGKDSYYAIYRYGRKVDVGMLLAYEFRRPNPHTVNLGKSVEAILLAGIPVIVVKLSRGREFDETLAMLKRLQADTIIAGDVYIEEHLNYMERLARELGATLIEPLWGLDPVELLHKEVEDGVRPVIIGCIDSLRRWLGTELNVENINDLIKYALIMELDPLGERGEYHTIVVNGPLNISSLNYKVVESLAIDGYHILRVM